MLRKVPCIAYGFIRCPVSLLHSISILDSSTPLIALHFSTFCISVVHYMECCIKLTIIAFSATSLHSKAYAQVQTTKYAGECGTALKEYTFAYPTSF